MPMIGGRQNPFADALVSALRASAGAQPANLFQQNALHAYREAVPAHVRVFASTLAGDRSPITENNLSPAEQASLMALVRRNQQSPAYKPGAVTYLDYASDPSSYEGAAEPGDGRAHVGPFKGGFNFGDPARTAVGNTIGQFRYKTLPDGSVTIDDSYDWDSGRPDGGQQSGRPSLADALTNAFRTGSVEQLGAWAVPDRSAGRPIHVTLRPQTTSKKWWER